MLDQEIVLKRPIRADFEAEDRRAAAKVKHLKSATFNFGAWKYRNPESGEMLDYGQVEQNCLTDSYPRLVWVRLLQQCFQYLPEKVRLMGEETMMVITDLAGTLEARAEHIRGQDKYIDALEKQNRVLMRRVEELDEANQYLEAKKEKYELETKVAQLQGLLQDIVNKKGDAVPAQNPEPLPKAMPKISEKASPPKKKLRFPAYGDREDEERDEI